MSHVTYGLNDVTYMSHVSHMTGTEVSKSEETTCSVLIHDKLTTVHTGTYRYELVICKSLCYRHQSSKTYQMYKYYI